MHYAVIALVGIATHNSCMKRTDIADKYGLDAGYLDPVMVALRNKGVVIAKHGPKGGYLLHRSIDSISLYDVALAIEQQISVPRCKNGKMQQGCGKNGVQCVLHGLWQDFEDNMINYLKGVSIADIISKQQLPSDE